MSRPEIEQYICYEKINIVEAMKLIDENSVGLVYVVDESDRLKGCLSDGDIRRWIISGGDLGVRVNCAMNKTPKYVYQENINDGTTKMVQEQIYSIAVVDKEMKIQDVIFLETHIKLLNKINRNALKKNPVIIMAGGKGTRLYPYTKILPKPLIPIGEIPIIERIMTRFFEFGVQDFFLTVNYKKEMIKTYFSDIQHEYKINYINEDKPLGTAGSIALIENDFRYPVIVTNCDTMIMENYEQIMEHHMESENGLTIVSSLKNTVIPYGVLKAKEHGLIISMEEKPQLSYFINTGMYIINPEYLKWIPKGVVFHMTDFAEMMMNAGKRVGMYPISERSFFDMGEFEELKRMEEWVDLKR